MVEPMAYHHIHCEFSGGLDLVFNSQQRISIALLNHVRPTIATVIHALFEQHANEKREMFVQNGKIRHGILVLINDVDWELAEKQDTLLDDNDRLSFISTLHGG